MVNLMPVQALQNRLSLNSKAMIKQVYSVGVMKSIFCNYGVLDNSSIKNISNSILTGSNKHGYAGHDPFC